MPRKKKSDFLVIRDKNNCIDVDETLYNQRKIFLSDEVCTQSIDDIIKDLFVLDMISDDPIEIFINTPGGDVDWGFALIDVIQKLRSEVHTVACGVVASMGTIISISGNVRKCFENTSFMFHDMSSGMAGSSAMIKDRSLYLERLYNRIEGHIQKYTKLTNADLKKARSGELWLFSDEALKKGLVDKII